MSERQFTMRRPCIETQLAHRTVMIRSPLLVHPSFEGVGHVPPVLVPPPSLVVH